MAGFSIKIGADASGYKNELNKMRSQTKAFSSKIGGIMKGVFAVASIGALRNISKEFAEMGLAAQTLGANTKEFQKFSQAANAYGLDVETVADAFKDLGVKITDASLDSKNAYAQNFAKMDFDFMAAATKDPVEQMYMFADALSKLSPAEARFQMDEINDAMFRMGPLLIRNRQELEKMVNKFKGFSKEELDSLIEGEAAWGRIIMQLKSQLVPALATIAEMLQDIETLMSGDTKTVKSKLGIKEEDSLLNAFNPGYQLARNEEAVRESRKLMADVDKMLYMPGKGTDTSKIPAGAFADPELVKAAKETAQNTRPKPKTAEQ